MSCSNKEARPRISPEPPSSVSGQFSDEGVRGYACRRYRGLDQRIVHAREVRLIGRLFKIIGREARDGGAFEKLALILDVPCGYGRFTGLLGKYGRKVIGCDLSLAMVRQAVRIGQQESRGERAPGLPLRGVVGNAVQGLPFRAGIFGAVVSIRLFHHIHETQDRESILREFLRVSSGWAVVSFYRMNALHAFQRRWRRKFSKSRTKIRMIESGAFEEEAKAAGFEVVTVLPLFRGIHAYHLALLRKR
jgi:SAM-dependent methyltransferase